MKAVYLVHLFSSPWSPVEVLIRWPHELPDSGSGKRRGNSEGYSEGYSGGGDGMAGRGQDAAAGGRETLISFPEKGEQ